MESPETTAETEEKTPRLADDVKEVLRKSEQLSDALQTLQSTNHSLRFYSNKLLVKLKEFTEQFSDETPTRKCAICYVRPRTHALVPCGHSMCDVCIKRCQERRCFVCRGSPTGVLKIFG